MLAISLLDLWKGDAVLAMAYGRPYREVLGLVSHAQDLGAPFVLISDRAAGQPAKLADAIIFVPRGRRGHVALHAGIVLALEIIVLALAASDRSRALMHLYRLNALRAAVLGEQRKV
jgi:DNA-binding MurR/RpiR family transcriptional regulator